MNFILDVFRCAVFQDGHQNTGHNQFLLTVHNILDTVLVVNDILRG